MKRLIVLAAALGASLFARAAEPEAAIREFIAAFSAGDMAKACRLVRGGKLSPELTNFGAQLRARPTPCTLDWAKLATKGNEASGQIQTTMTFGSRKSTETETVRLELTGSHWLIVPPAKSDLTARKKPVNSMAVLCAEGLTQVFADAKARAMQLSHIKQLGMATMMLAADKDDVVATTVKGWHKAIFPYCKNEKLFRSPGDPAKGDSYNLNPRMVGISLNRIKEPSKTVLLYEGRNGKLSFRIGGKAAVAFADGSCRVVTPEFAKTKLRWAP